MTNQKVFTRISHVTLSALASSIKRQGSLRHERPGHRAPQQRSERELAAPHAEKAIRRHDLDDGIDHT